MPPAVIAGGIAAAGTIGGAVLSSSAQKKASSQANQAQQAATDAQLQLGQQSLDLQDRLAQQSLGLNTAIYNSNFGVLSPYVGRGNVAGDAINALLGLPDAPQMRSPLAGTAMASGTVPAPVGAPAASDGPSGIQYAPVVSQTPLAASSAGRPATLSDQGSDVPDFRINHMLRPDLAIAHEAYDGINRPGSDFTSVTAATQPPPGALGHVDNPRDTPARDAINARRADRGLPPIGTTGPQPAGAAGSPAAGGTSNPVNALSPQSAFENFANSAGIQFQQQQAANAINHLYAAHGALQSGAAEKAISDRAENIALQNYFMPYMGMLGNQQAVGAGAASSIAGVGQNFGNTAANINANLASGSSAINAGMGGAIGAGANAAAQNAYNHGAANANMYAGIGSALGGLASSFVPMSGYGATGSSGGPIIVTGAGNFGGYI